MEHWTPEAIARLITQAGMSAVVAIWLMFRTDKKLDELTKAVTDLIVAIKR